MALQPNYPKTAKLEKANGIFIIFNDYEHEDDFSCFLDFLGTKLNVVVPNPDLHPYSLTTEIALPEGLVIAMFHDDTGCCVRVGNEARSLADQIINACYSAL